MSPRFFILPAAALLASCSMFHDEPPSCRPATGLPCMSLESADRLATEHPESLRALNHPGVDTDCPACKKGPDGDSSEGSSSEAKKTRPPIASNLGTVPLPDSGITPGHPIYREPKIARIWFAPWEDGAGLLHDQQYVYVVVDRGGWALRMHQMEIEQSIRMEEVRPPSKPIAPTQGPGTSNGPRPATPSQVPDLPQISPTPGTMPPPPPPSGNPPAMMPHS